MISFKVANFLYSKVLFSKMLLISHNILLIVLKVLLNDSYSMSEIVKGLNISLNLKLFHNQVSPYDIALTTPLFPPKS